ncbi:MAG: rRNA ((967)-C(5))-methyltransferase RsmB [Pseudomonadota bacterium]|jgi:16S rRNA (cytosine967-C5)-methyltransferase
MRTRQVAGRILQDVLEDGKSLTSALATRLPTLDEPRDRAFAQALSYGALRHYRLLQALLDQLASKPIRDEEIRLLALLGIFQLRNMTVKPYAAISTTVEAARKKKWAQPLLNGILRNYDRRRDELEASLKIIPGITFSYPDWLVDMISMDWPAQAASILEAGNAPPPMTLRINTRAKTREDYQHALQQASMESVCGYHSVSAITLTTARPVEQLPGFADGQVSIQDEGAQLAAPLLNVLPGERILDLCAAPGGKTIHLLESYPELGSLDAVDISADRIEKIQTSLDRCRLQARWICGDAARPETWWDGQAYDRILLDAPCSATGVIRRHPDIKWLRKPSDIEPLAAMQAAILESAWHMLKPGGTLLYVTCSILKIENEQQVSAFLAHHPDARESVIDAAWGIAGSHGRQILSGTSGMDGFFYARLVKAS